MSPVTWASTRKRCGSGSGRQRPIPVAGRDLLSSEEREELKRLRKENFDLRRANAILKDASVYFAQELDPTRRR